MIPCLGELVFLFLTAIPVLMSGHAETAQAPSLSWSDCNLTTPSYVFLSCRTEWRLPFPFCSLVLFPLARTFVPNRHLSIWCCYSGLSEAIANGSSTAVRNYQLSLTNMPETAEPRHCSVVVVVVVVIVIVVIFMI